MRGPYCVCHIETCGSFWKEWQIIEGVKLESDMGIFPLIIPVVNHKCLKWAVVHTKTERMGRFKIGRGEEGMKERE